MSNTTFNAAIKGPQGDTGNTGATGPEGPSAYDVAVTNGFVGDETAWLASLEGADGTNATGELNTIDSVTTGEPTGSDVVLNVVSLTQAEYDASTPVSTTLYIITDA
jgi:NADH:ubiquinone oxidoreductase subunit F (NADH-binding)